MNSIGSVKENELTREINAPHSSLKAQGIVSRLFSVHVFRERSVLMALHSGNLIS
jgi:hypothetical protein